MDSFGSLAFQAIGKSSVVQLLEIAVAACISYALYSYTRLERERAAFKKQNGCEPPASTYPNRDPFGFTFTYTFVSAAKQARALEWQHLLFQELGSTFVNQPPLGTTSVWTNDPDNVKVLLNNIQRFLVETSRYWPFKNLLGRGIFTSDGAIWHQSRTLLRKQFEKSQFVDLKSFEPHVAKLLAHLQDEGSTIDLQRLFHRFTMDASTEFLTGVSPMSLSTNEQAERARKFVHDFEYSLDDGILQARLGWIYHLIPHIKARRANRICREYIGKFVAAAIKHRFEEKDVKEEQKYTFVTELAKHPELGETRILDEATNVLLAGRDTTAALISHLFFHLARNQYVWKTLQQEVDGLGDEVPTYDQLRNLKYLDYCMKETLRLHPATPLLSKHAAHDTFLPRGGGSSGREPLFVPKGTQIFYNSYSLQRNKAVYGEDADSFRPEHWADETLRPGYSYIPFGAGPRQCLGQQYGLAEAGYATVRIMQNFRRIESRDDGPWREKLNASLSSRNGTKVALWKT